MITVKQHEKLIDRITSLSEIELDQLLKDIGQHLHKNKLEHLIDAAFQLDDQADEIRDLEYDLEELEKQKDKAIDKLDGVRILCNKATDIEEFEDKAFERLMAVVEEIIEVI